VRVPCNFRLAGNSLADIAAKAALLLSVFNLTTIRSDYNPLSYWT